MPQRNRHGYCHARETVDMLSVGQRVAALRVARKLSQPQLASLVGISQPSLSNIESGKTKKLRGDTLAGLCRALNVHPDAILTGKASTNPETMLHESELLAIWRALTPDDQDHLLVVARALGARMRPTAPQPQPAKPRNTIKA